MVIMFVVAVEGAPLCRGTSGSPCETQQHKIVSSSEDTWRFSVWRLGSRQLPSDAR